MNDNRMMNILIIASNNEISNKKLKILQVSFTEMCNIFFIKFFLILSWSYDNLTMAKTHKYCVKTMFLVMKKVVRQN